MPLPADGFSYMCQLADHIEGAVAGVCKGKIWSVGPWWGSKIAPLCDVPISWEPNLLLHPPFHSVTIHAQGNGVRSEEVDASIKDRDCERQLCSMAQATISHKIQLKPKSRIL